MREYAKRILSAVLSIIIFNAVLPAMISADNNEEYSVTGDVTYYRLQSYNYPDYYLRHYVTNDDDSNPNIIKIEGWAGGGSAHWDIVQGLTGDAGGENDYVSFESKNYPGYFLKKADDSDFIILEELKNTDAFKQAATFKREPGLADSSWYSYSSYTNSSRYIRHSGYVLSVAAISNETAKKDATFKETIGSNVAIYSENVNEVIITDAGGNEINSGDCFPIGTILNVNSTAGDGYRVFNTYITSSSGTYIKEIRNGGYFDVPSVDTTVRVIANAFTEAPSAFVHPGIALNMELLDNMKAHVKAGDELWVDAFNSFQSYRGVSSNEGSRKAPRIYWGEHFKDIYSLDQQLHQMARDADTAYAQTIMWYITGEDVYREYAMKIIRCYNLTNSVLDYINDDRIRISLAVAKFCVVAEILRYTDCETEEFRWTDDDTDGFTDFLLLMRNKYDRWWHYMNQQNMCTTATMASAVFRNDLDSYNRAVQRATTNPEVCYAGALCDRINCSAWDSLGTGHNISGDILSQIKKVTHNASTGQKLAEPNIQLVELGRDIGHAYCNIGSLSYSAMTSFIQGTKVNNDNTSQDYGKAVHKGDSAYADAVNMFEFADHRLLAGANYITKYNLGYDVTYIPVYQKRDQWKNQLIFTQVSDERGGPENEQWGRFDPAFAAIYNYYRYFDEGKAAVANGDADIKYLTEAYINTFPEGIYTEEFIGAGSLLYTLTGDDYDVIVEDEVFALQNVTVNSETPDSSYKDDGYLYVGGNDHTYIQFDLAEIDENSDLATLGLATLEAGTYKYIDEKGKEQTILKKYQAEILTGEWDERNATYNSLQYMNKVDDVRALKDFHTTMSTTAKYLIRDVIFELKGKGYQKITFHLYEEDPNMPADYIPTSAKAYSLTGSDNRHLKPRIVIQKLVNVNESPPSDESGYEDDGERLFTEKTNFAKWGYVSASNGDTSNNNFRLGTISGGAATDVAINNVSGSFVYYLGEGDLTGLDSVHYWGGYGGNDDVTIYYTRADDDYLKSTRLNFAANSVALPTGTTVKRYYESASTINKFISTISSNVLAVGKATNNVWNWNTEVAMTLSDNIPEGRYKVFLTTPVGNPAYIQFKYKRDWKVAFDKDTNTAVVVNRPGVDMQNDIGETYYVYAAVYNGGESGNAIKDVNVSELTVAQNQEAYPVDLTGLTNPEEGDVLKIFLWDLNLRPIVKRACIVRF